MPSAQRKKNAKENFRIQSKDSQKKLIYPHLSRGYKSLLIGKEKSTRFYSTNYIGHWWSEPKWEAKCQHMLLSQQECTVNPNIEA